MTEKKAKTQSRDVAFRATRKQHSNEAAEDYTELIADLIDTKGEARTCDIANHLGISHVTAVKTLKRLQVEGYIKTERQQPVLLTTKGKRTARFAKERHGVLVDLFLRIGIPRKIAEIDVEGAEHHISENSLKHIKAFLDKK